MIERFAETALGAGMGRPIRQETLTGSGAHKLVRQSKHNAIAAKLNERNVRSRASTGGPKDAITSRMACGSALPAHGYFRKKHAAPSRLRLLSNELWTRHRTRGDGCFGH
jgi:hypothetical protein